MNTLKLLKITNQSYIVVIGNIKNYLMAKNYILKITHSQIQKKFFGKIARGTRNFGL